MTWPWLTPAYTVTKGSESSPVSGRSHGSLHSCVRWVGRSILHHSNWQHSPWVQWSSPWFKKAKASNKETINMHSLHHLCSRQSCEKNYSRGQLSRQMQEGQFHIPVAKLGMTLMGVTPEPLLFPQGQTAFSGYLPAKPGCTWGLALCTWTQRSLSRSPGYSLSCHLRMETIFCHLSPIVCFL